MQLITAYELENRDDKDLSKLYREVARQLARSEPKSIERAKALTSLENISTAMSARFR